MWFTFLEHLHFRSIMQFVFSYCFASVFNIRLFTGRNSRDSESSLSELLRCNIEVLIDVLSASNNDDAFIDCTLRVTFEHCLPARELERSETTAVMRVSHSSGNQSFVKCESRNVISIPENAVFHFCLTSRISPEFTSTLFL